MRALVTKTTGLWHEVKSDFAIHAVRLRGKFKLENNKITNPIAVGDWVTIKPNNLEKKEWVITEIQDRTNSIIRQSPRKKGHDHIIASNVDQALIFFTFKAPRTSIGFIDRVLVCLEAFRIPAIILLNKVDLYSKEELGNWKKLTDTYENIGYRVSTTSLTEKPTDLTDLFKNKTTLLVGHSGTGKSSLINNEVPNTQQSVGKISSFTGKGIHTTTFAAMFFIDETTKLIDTPGIKEFGIAKVQLKELAHYFPEMRAHLGECKFHNCQHTKEPDCVIKRAVEAGEIAFFRYENYLSILNSESNQR